MKFSPDEKAAMSELNFFILKDSVTRKIIDLFGSLEKELKSNFVKFNIQVEDLNITTGKIFRGENYKLYPYILLDYPKLFSKKSVFAFRTMFWWGHEFSFTLHLQGEALEQYRKSIYNNFHSLQDKNVFYCVNDTPWQYYFEKDNYIRVEETAGGRDEILTISFLKLSRKIPVQSFPEMIDYSLETFRLFMGILEKEK